MRPSDSRLWFSDRGIPLVYTGKTPKVAVVTCENYLKWYGLDVVCPDGVVRKLHDAHPDFNCIDQEVERAAVNPCWCDHTFHPGYVREIAEKLGFAVDEQALEMIAGRWAIETLSLPQMEYVKR